MKRRFTDVQITRILEQHEAGVSDGELCRERGMWDATFYKWRSKLGGMEVSEAKQSRDLEDENRKLKRLAANCGLDKRALEDVLKKI